ncbi:dTDP-glucose 4,6-dehydratase [Cryptosporangium sp. NPDC051539]|uniref:dTDP-glucose 4,6-dehydratase n=1 Tax=Cryptosporangium sp. NPDC051539 TaxID=3363962 RepID=UPI00378E270E
MRVLVTGGAGFIGSHFVRSLLQGMYPSHENTHVTVLDKLTYAGGRDNLPADDPRLTFVHGDICDRELLADLVPGHDALVHFAAESHVDRSVADAEPFLWANVVGTHRLLEQCRQHHVERVVHVSTDEVYGSIQNGSWTELYPMQPNNPYAASKAASDCMARSLHRSFGLDLSITRCSNNYGPRQHPEKIIPKFITRLLRGQDVTLHGDGSAVREWIHVDDHCRGISLVLDKGRPGEIYNIGGGVEMTNRELTRLLLELGGAGWDRVSYVADRVAQDQRYSLDRTKISEELGFEPEMGFREGLLGVFDWYRDNGEWWESRAQG